MKKVVVLLLAAVLLCGLGGQTPPTSGGITGETKTEQESESTAEPGGLAGVVIKKEYEADAYANEKTAEEQLLEDALLQYGGPRLSSLSVAGAELIPFFSAETFSYAAYVEQGLESVSISAVTASGSVYINGTAGSTRRVSLSGGEQTVRVIVTDGSLSTTYSILLLRMPNLQQAQGLALITRVQIANDDVFYERELSPEDGNDITLTLPEPSGKKFYVSVTVQGEALVYYNNTRVYNGYYDQHSGQWTWTRQGMQIAPGDTLLGVHLADTKTKAVLNYYSFRIKQPGALRIELQVGNEQSLVNGELRLLDAPPLIMEGHTMVPLRFIAEALGATVSWDAAEQRVDIKQEEKTLQLFIGKQTGGLPQAPFIENNRTMVPLRYVSEQLGCEVEWLAATREIIITR